jgi:metal-responsive CopG/Arc/MetJ family transcriptional regulator
MNKQINVRLPMKLREQATAYAKKNGYGSVQELIAETLRDKVVDDQLTARELKFIDAIIKHAKEHPETLISEDEFKRRYKMSF